jgi:hypothetical protein
MRPYVVFSLLFAKLYEVLNGTYNADKQRGTHNGPPAPTRSWFMTKKNTYASRTLVALAIAAAFPLHYAYARRRNPMLPWQ